MADSVFRAPKKRAFTHVMRDVAQDARISLKARGLILLMSSLPDNWEYTISGLAKKAGTGKDQIRSALSELLEVGYLVKEQSHSADGKFAKNIFILQEEAPPLSGKPTTGKPTTGNPLSGNPTQNNKEENKKDKKTPLPPAEVIRRIEEYAGGDQELMQKILDFVCNRKAALGDKKAVKTVSAINGLLSSLDDGSLGDRLVKLAMLQKAINHNWQGIFPLKPDELVALKREHAEKSKGGGYGWQ